MRATCLMMFLLMSSFGFGANMNEDQQLQSFFEEEWEWVLKENPVFATSIGDYRYNDRWRDVSLQAEMSRQQHGRESLQRLQNIKREKLSESSRLNYDLYLHDLKLEIEAQKFPDHLMQINQMGGVQQDASTAIARFPFKNTRHYEDYLARLKKLPKVIDDTIAILREGANKGITPPRITLREVDDQIQSQIVSAAEKSPFYEPFQQFPTDIKEEEGVRLQSTGKRIIEEELNPAYSRLLDFWNKEYLPKTKESIGIKELPQGREWYEFRARYFTTTNLTPQQIHDIGQSEVKRIRAEMEKVIRQTKFQGTFQQFLEFLRKDPQFYYTKPEDLLMGYRDICKRIDPELPKLFGKLPRLSYGVREIPAYSAPSNTTAYYNQGSIEAGLPGWFYANTYKLDMRPKWEMEALSIHEAVPGHHLQISLAQEMENVPNFRKHAGVTAFVEGWGLYSESLGPEMGMYKDPYSKFGQLTYEMWRAVRLVVDTGMHYMGWDRQKAIDFFKANSSKPEHDIVVEIDRYIVWPGQALAYKIGELKIKELRKYAADQLGQKFDIREFHDRVLGNGAVPLSILETHIKQYVEQKKKSS